MAFNIGTPTKLTDQKWLNLFQVQYDHDGKSGTWLFASRNGEPKPGPEPTVANAVVIVPLLKDGRKRKLVTIKEFRIPMGDYEYGFPAGLIDPGEDLVKTVKRELKEETGLKAGRILITSSPVVSSAGLSDEAVQYVFVECTGTPDTSHADGPEDITVDILDLDGVAKLRKSGSKIGAKAWPILLMFEAMGRIAIPSHVRDEAKVKKIKKEDAVQYCVDEAKKLDPNAPSDPAELEKYLAAKLEQE